MKIVETKKQINNIYDIIQIDLDTEMYYLGEKDGVVYVMEDRKDYRENTTYNPVGIIDIKCIGRSNIKRFLKELFDCYNLTAN